LVTENRYARESQSAVIAYLEKALRRGADPVSIIHTHISIIFLSGDRAYKMKRAVTLPYVDLSSVEARVEACRKELKCNSVTAPETYLAVRLVTDEGSGRSAIDGKGYICDVLVEMVRFDQKLLLDNLARNGALTSSQMRNLACSISRYHRSLTPVHITSGRVAVSKVIEINQAAFATSSVFGIDEVSEPTAAFARRLSQFGELLDDREQGGKVCRCHGDLHLRNIFLYEGEPRLFDCIASKAIEVGDPRLLQHRLDALV
jgi:aminoglycoside phosphotransferase family enzyme